MYQKFHKEERARQVMVKTATQSANDQRCKRLHSSTFWRMQFLKLHNMKQIYMISEESFVLELFIGSVSILNVLASPIILSMCTRLLDIFLFSITITQDILFIFLKNVGVFISIFLS